MSVDTRFGFCTRKKVKLTRDKSRIKATPTRDYYRVQFILRGFELVYIRNRYRTETDTDTDGLTLPAETMTTKQPLFSLLLFRIQSKHIFDSFVFKINPAP